MKQKSFKKHKFQGLEIQIQAFLKIFFSKFINVMFLRL